MKKSLPWLIALVGAAFIAAATFRPEPAGDWHWREFGRLPVVLNGRIKPLDTVARTSLLVIHDKQSWRENADVPRTPAIAWLAEVLFDPAKADQRKVFTIHNPEVIGLLGEQRASDVKHFSFAELRPHFRAISEAYELAEPLEAQVRTQFQTHVVELYRHLILFQSLKNTLQPEDSPDFAREVDLYLRAIPSGREAMEKRETGQSYDDNAFNAFLTFASRYRDLDRAGHFLAIPPEDPGSVELRTDWDKMGLSLAKSVSTAELHPAASLYVQLGASYRAGDTARFNTVLQQLSGWIEARYGPEMTKVERETFFNRFQPFYQSMVVYVLAGLFAVLSWAFGPGFFGRTALALGCLAFTVQTIGLVFRVYLQNYPPVTNLYSAAVVVGWGAAGIGLLVEFWFRNAIGTAVAAVVGFCTLLVAQHLSLGGDTMEMMQAVLDSNFWLSVHVPTIVFGYSATYAAGAAGIFYLVLRAVRFFVGPTKPVLTPRFGQVLTRIAYGIICFATLLSFVGTVLGGIWADQSWGRFWGWDPKENGAALIVLWNAIILHARMAGLVRECGIMVMAIGGNIITTWSFFGTNMLGIGLHSYGFTNEGFFWMISFMISQVAFMLLGLVPERSTARATGAKSSALPPSAREPATGGVAGS